MLGGDFNNIVEYLDVALYDGVLLSLEILIHCLKYELTILGITQYFY